MPNEYPDTTHDQQRNSSASLPPTVSVALGTVNEEWPVTYHEAVVEPIPQPELPAGYVMFSRLGRGGMVVVYRVRHLSLNRVVAFKMMLAGGHTGAIERTRFRQEAEAVARLDHPNIVKIFEVGEFDGALFFTLEYVSGGTLETAAKNPLVARDVARLMVPIARAIAHAHTAGIVHRDLKPANILLGGSATPDRDPEASTTASIATCVPKVTDFGLRNRSTKATASPPAVPSSARQTTWPRNKLAATASTSALPRISTPSGPSSTAYLPAGLLSLPPT